MKWIDNIEDEVKKKSYFMSLELLRDKRTRYFKRNKTNNRLDTNLTNLKKDLRKFIIGDYVNIDLKNSQPFFLFCLLDFFGQTSLNNNNASISINNNLNYPTIPLCSEIKFSNLCKTFGAVSVKKILKNAEIHKEAFFTNLSMYREWVVNGKFYDNFMVFYSGKYTRAEIKAMMFAIMFSENQYSNNKKVPYKLEKAVFSNVFQKIYEVITELKNKNYKSLAICLQKIESEIFIDVISKRLVEVGIIPLTIHDSVIVKSNDTIKVLEIMKNVFQEIFNQIPQFEVEPLNG